MTEQSKSSLPKVVILDEFSSYFGNPSDSLRRELRDVQGVPNAKYLVDGNRVFVFEKLVELAEVNQAALRSTDKLVPEAVLSLMSDAWVTAAEAVRDWGIIPTPYKLAEGRLLHEPFNALVPAEFDSKDELDTALATLLVGGIVHSNGGDFEFNGQPLLLREDLDIAGLPQPPDLNSTLESVPDSYTFQMLKGAEYIAGFAPLTPLLFTEACEADRSWSVESGNAKRVAFQHVAAIWPRLQAISLESLNEDKEGLLELDEEDEKNAEQLADLYPELRQLSRGSLYSQFSEYQSECRFMNSFDPHRDDCFIFYLLGRLIAPDAQGDRGYDMGQIAAFGMLRGDSWEAAAILARKWDLYGTALYSLTDRIVKALRFLIWDNATSELRGGDIVTMVDTFAMARKYKVGTIMATQSIDDLKGE